MADTAKATEAGNRQRAFRDGVEHLGSGKASVRQGGAHALFHLALEDEKLRASIAGVLCAHIRETTGDKDYQEQNKGRPSTEMQSLLSLLFTTETVDEVRLERFWQDITPDLDDGYFRGVKLESAQFRGAKLNWAQFQGASLWKAQFQGASLWEVRFQGALLDEAQFQGTWLDEAQFQGASLEDAEFQGARLWGARFQGARLEKAEFQGARLGGARFQGARMKGIRFHAADLKSAQFQGADLRRAQFQGARLFGSQFQGASFYAAEFQQARFGQGSEYEDIPAQDRTVTKSDELVEKFKASAFHGASSESVHVYEEFEERINDRTDKESDFSGVIFAGGVTQELLAEVKEMLAAPVKHASAAPVKHAFWFINDPDFKKKLVRNLESEIGKPASNALPADVMEGLYGQEDAEQWIREFREAMATVPGTNQAA